MLCVTCLFFAIKPTNFTEIFVESSFMRGSSSVHKLLELSLNLNATIIDDLITYYRTHVHVKIEDRFQPINQGVITTVRTEISISSRWIARHLDNSTLISLFRSALVQNGREKHP